MTRMAPALSIAVGLALAACAAPQAGHMRFHNRAPVTIVNDRDDVREKPSDRKFYRLFNRFDAHFHKRVTRWMAMPAVRRAANVNSIDEVPDSTWFTNRIGIRDLSVDEMRRGPTVTGSPEEHLPLTIKSSKVGGVSVGFIVKDTRGKKYILKFDDPRFPESETGANIVGQRLVWAAGYNVPEDHVIYLRREDLVLGNDAEVKDPMGKEARMSRAFLDLQLSKVHVEPGGRIRAVASEFLDGTPVGGHPQEGVRDDDRNDRVPHEHRRELRGAYVLFAWLEHTDMKEDNSLDTYVEDPANPKVHYLVHYLIDFGKALGVQGQISGNRALGLAYMLDFRDMSLSLLSLGLWRRPWEARIWPEHITGVGVFESGTYDPQRWKPNTPTYLPFHRVDRFDGFWAAKNIIRFTRPQIRAAVEQGRYSDPRAVEYLTRVLVERQRRTARHWFAAVTPIDRFAVESTGPVHRLCFEDLALRYRLTGGAPRETVYGFTAFDHQGREHGWRASTAGAATGRACARGIPLSTGRDGYTIIRIDTARAGRRLPAVLVHVARDPRSGAPRVIGLRRQ